MMLPRQVRSERPHGFTLMEVLLALAVSAVILSAIGGVFFSALRLRDRTTAMLDDAAPVQRTVSTIRRDLQGAAAPNGDLTGLFRSEEHTSELQSLRHLVCRLLLEKKNRQTYTKKPQ